MVTCNWLAIAMNCCVLFTISYLVASTISLKSLAHLDIILNTEKMFMYEPLVAIEGLLDLFSACSSWLQLMSFTFSKPETSMVAHLVSLFFWGNSKVIFKLHVLRSSFQIYNVIGTLVVFNCRNLVGNWVLCALSGLNSQVWRRI